jgi:pyridoxine 5-phosphate synthase
MTKLGVNIDHIATIRQARQAPEPDPVAAAILAELAGADGITVHLRGDRRHIQDSDVRRLRDTVATRLNLEMAATSEMVRIATEIRPDQSTLVPEKEKEITTEGGLNVVGNLDSIVAAVRILSEKGIQVSLFIDPDPEQVDAAADLGAAERGRKKGLKILAGHGLTYRNVRLVSAVPEIEELNIGHNIIARASLVGMDRAVREMRQAMNPNCE